MAALKYWTNSTRKTLTQTLYAAILRDIQTKIGNEARFTKAERGKSFLLG